MLAYSLIMFAVAILFLIVGLLIYRGKTSLIHSYHQRDVKDKVAYGKAFSKGISGLSITFVISGLIALFGKSLPIVFISLSVLFIGFILAIAFLWKIQKKYNND